MDDGGTGAHAAKLLPYSELVKRRFMQDASWHSASFPSCLPTLVDVNWPAAHASARHLPARELFRRDVSSPPVRYVPITPALFDRFNSLEREDFDQRRSAVDAAFLRQGITFTVYSDEQGTERIFPFDLMPRIIPNSEWIVLEEGLKQRMRALNLFLKDVYSEQRIIKENIVPRIDVETAKHFRPEMMGFSPPKDIYIHVCGSDLVRDGKGTYYVLEDNGRCPSGVSYLLENRMAMKRAFPHLFSSVGVRPVDHYTADLLTVLQYCAPRGKPQPDRRTTHARHLQQRLL